MLTICEPYIDPYLKHHIHTFYIFIIQLTYMYKLYIYTTITNYSFIKNYIIHKQTQIFSFNSITNKIFIYAFFFLYGLKYIFKC